MTTAYVPLSKPKDTYLAVPEVDSNTGKVVSYKTRYIRPIARWVFGTFALISLLALGIGLAGLLHSVLSDDSGSLSTRTTREVVNTAQITSLVDRFAYTITRRDIDGNINLFSLDGVANYRSVFPEFSAGNHTVHDPPGVGSYITDLENIYLTYISSHMTLSNINITLDGTARADVDAIGFLSRTIDDIIAPIQFKTHLYSFSMYFEMVLVGDEWLISYAHTLVNATKSESLGSGIDYYFGSVSGPATLAKKRSHVMARAMGDFILWQNLLAQIQSLLDVGQTVNARDICQTTAYIALAAEFDPGANPAFFCNQPVPIQQVPLTGILMCESGSYVDSSCINATDGGGSSLVVPTDIFESTPGPGGVLEFQVISQIGNQIWASPSNGAMGYPAFRYLVSNDIPTLDINLKTTGILSLNRGGTNNAGPFTGGSFIITNPGGTAFTTGPTVPPTIVASVGLAAPLAEFTVGGSPVTSSGTLTLGKVPQLAKTFWAGPLTGSPAEPTFRPIIMGDLPVKGMGANLTLAGNCVMMSDVAGDKLVEGTLIGYNGIQTIKGPGDAITIQKGGVCVIPDSDTCIPPLLTLETLSVSGDTLLGTNTSCLNPLKGSCYDISMQHCIHGPLNTNCIPQDLILNSLFVYNLTVFNDTGMVSSLVVGDTLEVNNLISHNTIFSGPVICNDSMISQDCFSLGGQTCPGGVPLDESCIPASLIFSNITVTGSLIVNDMTCGGGHPIADSCLGILVKTINGIMPGLMSYNFDIIGDVGVMITPAMNGITIAVDHNSITNYVANQHIDHTSVIITAGVGLSGGGNIASSFTIDLENTGVTAGSYGSSLSIPVITVNAQGQLTTVSLASINATEIDHNSLFNYETLRHIDHSAVSINPGTGLTGGGTIDATRILSIDNTGVTAGSYGSVNTVPMITVNAQGQLTTAASVSINHNTLSNYVANQHIDHSLVSINTAMGSGLTGGGDLTVTRNLVIDTTGVTAGSYGSSTLIPVITVNARGQLTVANHVALGGGTVTSVGLAAPAEFTVSGSPVVGTGTLTLTKTNQTANTFWGGPTSGISAEPIFRPLVAADIPSGVNLGGLSAGAISLETLDPPAMDETMLFDVSSTSIIVPASGIYLAIASVASSASSGSAEWFFYLYNDAVKCTNSDRRHRSSNPANVETHCIVNAVAASTIKLRAQKISGTGTLDVTQRSIIVLRIG